MIIAQGKKGDRRRVDKIYTQDGIMFITLKSITGNEIFTDRLENVEKRLRTKGSTWRLVQAQ
jgi:hypothetical protein